MADTEEPQFNSLAERIAALNQQRNFTTPTAKRPPPPPPPNRPPSRAPSQVNSPPLNGAAQNATPVVPARPTKKAPPALPQRSNTEPQNGSSPTRSLAPQRQASDQISPALPPRRPSTQSLTTRRNSNESVKSHASCISALSLNQTTSHRGNDGRKLPPPLEEASLPPLPPTRREREAAIAKENEDSRAASTARMAKPPLLPKRSMPALPQAASARPSLPPRLPSRPARSPGLNGADASPPAQPTRRLPPPPDKFVRTIPEVSGDTSGGTPADPSTDVPPPIPIASRPSAAQIDAATANSSAQQAASCLVCRDFSGPDSVAAQYPSSVVDRRDPVGYLASVLCGPFPSPTDKARAIFTWCHHNIAYVCAPASRFFFPCIAGSTQDFSVDAPENNHATNAVVFYSYKTQLIGGWPFTSRNSPRTPLPLCNVLTFSRMLKASLAVVSRGAQRAILFSPAKQSAKAMPASTKPSRSVLGWNASSSGVMAKAMGSPHSRTANGRLHGKPQATLGTRSRSTMGTGSCWMPAGGLAVSVGRVTVSISNRTSLRQAMRCSGMSPHFFSFSFVFQRTSRRNRHISGGKDYQSQPGPQSGAWCSKFLPDVLQVDEHG